MPSELVLKAVEFNKISLNHRIVFQPNDAKEFIENSFVDYNDYTKRKTLTMLSKIENLLFIKDGVFKGNIAHCYEIGREYSPVIRVKVTKFYFGENFDWKQLTKEFKNIGKAAKADDSELEEFDGRWIWKFYWD